MSISSIALALLTACGGGSGGSADPLGGTALDTTSRSDVDASVSTAGVNSKTTAPVTVAERTATTSPVTAVVAAGSAVATAASAAATLVTAAADVPVTAPDITSRVAAPSATALATVSTASAVSSVSELQAANASAWPFVQPSLASLRASPKKVFAHYFTPFPISIDNQDPANDYYTTQYLSPSGENNKFVASGGFIKQRPLPRPVIGATNWDAMDSLQDVRRAVALGIDGFAVDLLATSGVHWNRAVRMLDTAAQVDPGFKIILMPDMEAEFKGEPQNVLWAVRQLAGHPAAYRLADGRLVLAPYNAQNQSPAWWKQTLATLRDEGIQIAFFPVFQNWSAYANDFAPFSYGMSDWGDRSPGVNRAWGPTTPARAQALGMKWMSAVAPQDARAKDLLYWEAGNSENYRVMWESAINGNADWVQIITWNDYSEGSEIAPSSGTQSSFYDLTAYYTAWFKTGVKPAITKDVLYYFHRKQATTALPNPVKQPRPYTIGGGSDAPANDVEVVAFTTAASTLTISVGGQSTKRDVAAGMSSTRVPMKEGTPSFALTRGATAVTAVQSGFPISNTVVYQDFLYRSGSSSRALVAPR